MRIATDRALIPANAKSARFLTVEIDAPEKPRPTQRAPVNVALVLDRSGSMGGQKIDLAREAVAQAIRLLDSRDRLAIVVFDEQIDVVLESTPASSEAKSNALRRLGEVGARGTTALHAGWCKGADELLRHVTASAEGTASRVLLLTDGQANVGTTDPETLATVAAELRAKGVVTTTFGLGADFDEDLLSRLATAGGGHFYFIEHPRQIPDVLTSELGEALDIVAPEAELVVSGSDQVTFYVLNDIPAERRRDDMHVKLGDLVSGQTVRVVLQLGWAPLVEGAIAAVDCRLTDRAGALYPQPMRVEWTAASGRKNAEQPVNADVLIAAAEQLAAKVSSAALAANRAGRFEKAARVLTEGAAALRELGPIPAVERLARELERKREQYSSAMDALTAKEQHFVAYSQRVSREPDGKARRSSSQ